jgi:hypothetical protein
MREDSTFRAHLFSILPHYMSCGAYWGSNTVCPKSNLPSHPGSEHASLEWLDLVEMYSRCDLTEESDKLIAVLGISRRIHVMNNQNYCVGIWADKLCQGLLWLTNPPYVSGPFPRAPSWSWAAWDGAIQYPLDIRTDRFVPRCKLVSLETHSGEPTSFLNGPGALVIRGKLVDVSSFRHRRLPSFISELGPGFPRKGLITRSTTDLPLISLKSYVRVGALWQDNAYRPAGWIAPDLSSYFDAQEIQVLSEHKGRPHFPLESTFFLVIGNSRKGLYGEYGDQGTCFFGIFLTRKDTQPKPIYKRCEFGQLALSFVRSQTKSTSQI